MTTSRRGAAPEPVLVSWSGGKDSALALASVLRDPALRVEGLLTTVTAEYDRVSIHGVRRSLLAAQAEALGVPLHEVAIPAAASNADYEAAMRAALAPWPARGVRRVAFGDLFLADVRAYRDRLLASVDMEGLYPLWGADTGTLARAFVAGGYRATLVCVDPRQVPASLAGRAYDAALLAELPRSADPCAERGEFHTFVHDGPIFRHPVPVMPAEVVERDGFVFQELHPGAAP